jgi:cytochrome c oxidase subunit II
MTIIGVSMLSISYSTIYGTSSSSAATTLTIPVGAATPGNPSYEPVSLTVKRGDEIEVINEDSSPHTVTNGKGPDDPDTGKKFDTTIIPPGTPDEPERV